MYIQNYNFYAKLVMISVESLLRRMATGEKGPATELKPKTYTVSQGFRYKLSLPAANPLSPITLYSFSPVTFLLSSDSTEIITRLHLLTKLLHIRTIYKTYNCWHRYLWHFSPVHMYIALPIPVVLISIASSHQYYLIRHSFDEGSPHYNQVKAWVSACTEIRKIRFL